MASTTTNQGVLPADEKTVDVQNDGPGPIPQRSGSSSGADDETVHDKPSDAVRDLETHHGINEKALLRRIDGKLLPTVGILYLLSFLDRSNGGKLSTRFQLRLLTFLVGNARIEGLTTDINISMPTPPITQGLH